MIPIPDDLQNLLTLQLLKTKYQNLRINIQQIGTLFGQFLQQNLRPNSTLESLLKLSNQDLQNGLNLLHLFLVIRRHSGRQLIHINLSRRGINSSRLSGHLDQLNRLQDILLGD